MLSFLSLASGSKGNATLVYDEKTTLLFDMGVSKKLLFQGLQEIGRNLSDLTAAFITHEHSDHVKGISYIPKTIPVYASTGTIDGAINQRVGSKIRVGDFVVISFKTSHDAHNPVGYKIENRGESLVFITDTGFLPLKTVKDLANPDYAILEANHDIQMLLESNRPEHLKRRIRGKKGHLSNEQSALISLDLVGEKTKKVYLCHRSEECNTEEKIMETYKNVYEEYGVAFDESLFVILQQWSFTRGGDRQ